MTEGLRRFYSGNDLHFLTFSCYRRRPLFSNEAYCDLFLKIVERVRRRYRLVVLGYVVMPEHVHLLVSEPQRETLSTAIQALKLGVVRSMQCSGGSVVVADPRSRKNVETSSTPVSGASVHPDRFWQARFYDFNVWTDVGLGPKPVAPGPKEMAPDWRGHKTWCGSLSALSIV